MSNTFDSVVEPEFHNKKIKLKCIVTGKTLAPYHIPKKLHVRCPHKKCPKCKYRTTMEVILDATDENILTYIDAKTHRIAALVKDTIKAKCRSLEVEVLDVQLVERIFIARPTGKERTRKGGGSRAAYVLGQSIETNLVYEFEGYTTNDPMTQQITHVFTSATKVQNDIESFNLSLNKHNQLERFCVGPNVNAEGMFRRLVDIYDRYAYNITKIYERADLHLAVDMLFRSVISFNFDNERVHKGWTDAMIIGDTRCGKGYVAEKLIEYFGLGETVSGENCLSGNTEIVTKEKGLVNIKDVVGKVTILDGCGDWVESVVKDYGVQKTVTLRFTKNKRDIFVRSTLDHDWELIDGTKVKAKDLKIKDKIPFVKSEVHIDDENYEEYLKGIIHGIVYGDGCRCYTGWTNRKQYKLRLCGEKNKELIEYFEGYTISSYPAHNGDLVVYVCDTWTDTVELKELPDESMSDEYLMGFFRGWLAADGSVNVVNKNTKACQVSIFCKEKDYEWIRRVLVKVGYYVQGYDVWEEGGFGKYKEPRYYVRMNTASFTEDDFLISSHRSKFLGYSDVLDEYCYSFRGIVENSERYENVYCAQVQSTHTFVISEGLLTGNCSFAGLVGGLQQFNKQWVITWGKIPMNDCGLLMIDETSGMEENMWGKLSRIRSEGVAEITKIQTQVTNARTRLLFVCNAPNKAVNSYSYGIQSITDMIKAPEDIARFDYVLVVAHNEVPGKVINTVRTGQPLKFEQQLEQDLILWCWSRKPEEVFFTPEATSMIYEMALKISKVYDFSIPLIQVENVRFKLAKIAIAMAARFYSNKENGKYLYVDKVHVECAWIFFDVIYKKDQSGYFQYSKMKMSEMEITTPQKLREIEAYFDSWKLQRKELLRCLLVNNYIDPNDITVHLGVNKDLGNECVSNLLKTGCLQKKGRTFVKTPEFTAYLKRILLGRKKLIPKTGT